MTLWTAAEAVKATGGTTTGDWVVSGLSIDTRSIEVGEMFIALKDQRDGHDFVGNALDAGASAALVSRVPDGVSPDAPLLIVDDVLTALQDMARYARTRTGAKVIGVTGSVGKTSTKEMLRTALSDCGRVHAAERSFNNHWGVPLTLARMPADSDFAVIEIGMNHPDEIRPLAKLAKLDVAIVTNVAAVHLEAFESIEQIAHAKAEIFESLDASATAIVNVDLPTTYILMDMVRQVGAQLIGFGQSVAADYRVLSIKGAGAVTQAVADIDGQERMYEFQAAGDHFAMNALAVLAAGVAAGCDLDKVIRGMAKWTAPDGRGARHVVAVDGGKLTLIDESYNANPSSMASALAVLGACEITGRRIAVLGEMGELGETELQRHAELAALETVSDVDQFHLVGPMMEHMYNALPPEKRGVWVKTADELVDQIKNLLSAGDTVMVKGSNYTRVSRVVDAIKNISA
jgi:UDP-N-acetylmuramoyl-tripeptide--D-alanyl-D-alanine ligase